MEFIRASVVVVVEAVVVGAVGVGTGVVVAVVLSGSLGCWLGQLGFGSILLPLELVHLYA